VRDDQLSLAIGKRGQNVRLAARLTGWDIDILTPEEFTKGLETMYRDAAEVEGITEAMADKLAALGMVSVFDIEEVGAEVLVTTSSRSTEDARRRSSAQAVVDACAIKAKESPSSSRRTRKRRQAPLAPSERPHADRSHTATPPHRPGEGGPPPSRPASAPPSRPAQPPPTRSVTPAPMNVPTRPNVVTPAGPRLQVVTPVKLSGPKVVRVEAPEQVEAPRPRGPRGPSSGPGGPRMGGGAGGSDDDRGRSPRRKETPGSAAAKRSSGLGVPERRRGRSDTEWTGSAGRGRGRRADRRAVHDQGPLGGDRRQGGRHRQEALPAGRHGDDQLGHRRRSRRRRS
jgi:hypothetical protein